MSEKSDLSGARNLKLGAIRRARGALQWLPFPNLTDPKVKAAVAKAVDAIDEVYIEVERVYQERKKELEK